MISTGCLEYFGHVYDISVEAPFIDLVLMASEFPIIFPIYLLGFPPERVFVFAIDLKMGTKTISITLNQMALAKLKELIIWL